MTRLSLASLLVSLAVVGAIGCGTDREPAPTPTAKNGNQPVSLELTSPAFAPGEAIPAKYTCDGENVSPPLQWRNAPEETQSLALIADDPDTAVGTWVHWVVYGLSPETEALAEAIPAEATLPDSGRQGNNGLQKLGYFGPCPPSGSHRYFFKLYALDTMPELPAGASKEQLLEAMEGHVLAQAELMGRYSRQ